MRRAENVIIIVQGQDDASVVFRQVASELARMSDKGGKSLGVLDGVMVGLGQQFLSWGKQIPRVASEMINLGAQAKVAAHRFTAFAGGAGMAEEYLSAFLAGAEGAADKMTAMSSAAKLLQMGLTENADEMRLVAAMATKLGDQTESVTNRVSGFALMLANQSIPRLDNYGISSGRVRKRIEELQAQIAGLSREEAFKRAVFEEGTKALETLGDTSGTTATEIDKLKASITNLKVSMSESLAESAKTPIAWANAQLSGAELRNELVRLQDEMVSLGMLSQEQVDAFDRLEMKMKLSQASSAELTTVRGEELAKLRDLRMEYETSAGMMDSWQRAIYSAAAAEEKATQKSIGLWSALGQQMEAVRGVTAEWFAFAEAVGGRIGDRSPFEFMADSINEMTAGVQAAIPELEMMKEEQRQFAEEARLAAAALGDEFVGYLGDATAGADTLAMALFDAADASGLSHDQLALMASQLGIASEAEVEAALQATVLKGAMIEMAQAVAAGTMSIAQAAAALNDLRAELPAGIALLEQQTAAASSYASASSAMSQADREAAKAQRELQRQMAKTGDYFMDALRDMGVATRETDKWAAALFMAADASGASSEELAGLGQELGLWNEEAIEAALKTAAMQEKIAMLGQRIAGGLSAGAAIAQLRRFQTQIFGPPALQSGTSFWRGGTALVGEGSMSGELVNLPRGAQVLSAGTSRHITNNWGGDVVHLHDSMAAESYNRERRVRRRAAMAGFMA